MEDKWKYRIEPYRRIPDDFGWTRAKEAGAEAWFGFRERGDDHRCFGVFYTRKGAERAMEMLKEQERSEAAMSEAERFSRLLDDKSSPEPSPSKQQDKGIER